MPNAMTRRNWTATAMAPSAPTPTLARKIVLVTCTIVSLVCANRIGRETDQTARDMARVAIFPLQQAHLIGEAVEVHHHTREQRSALEVLAQIEVRHVE